MRLVLKYSPRLLLCCRMMKQRWKEVEALKREALEAEQRAEAAEQRAAALQVELDTVRSDLRARLAAADQLVREQAFRLDLLAGSVAWQQHELQQTREEKRRLKAALLELQQKRALLEAAVEAAEERRRGQAL